MSSSRRSDSTGYGFDFEVLYLARLAGHAVIELPTVVRNRGAGSVSAASYLSTLSEVLQVRWNRLTRKYAKRAAYSPGGVAGKCSPKNDSTASQ